MKSLIIIIALLLFGIGGGVGAGLVMAPAPKNPGKEDCVPGPEHPCPEEADHSEEGVDLSESDAETLFDYIKLPNQYVIPLVHDDRVVSLVVVSLTLEVTIGTNTVIFDREPKLRDAFLQAMFDFAYLGGFDGAFTKSDNLDRLRRNLREIGQRLVGSDLHDVLITDIVRQEI